MNAVYSRYNLFARLRDAEDYFIANLLTGNADLLSSEEARRVQSGHLGELERAFREKGYLTHPEEERALYARKYREFLERREQEEVQLFFVPRYSCNFACFYCYQSGYEADPRPLRGEVTDAFFAYTAGAFEGRRAYVTLFGGEPLMSGRQARESLAYFVTRAEEQGRELALVTNGYHLSDHLDLLSPSLFREIQVTLDGTREVHDRRRPLRAGFPTDSGRAARGTFDRIAAGIDSALEQGHTVNLRVVLDRENMPGLPGLARFAAERGWTASSRFKTQLGRNYELHTCQPGRYRLYDRAAFYGELYRMLRAHPEVAEFHRPAFSFSRFLFENGRLPQPLFDACPACKTEWAFDYTGTIYPCTATVGKQDEAVGSFYPHVRLDRGKILRWRGRDVTSIPRCAGCPVSMTCGGGCGAVAGGSTGDIRSPDCHPELELAAMGLSLYREHTPHERSSCCV
ncbi:MAG: radical SAM protein [Spirochaetota bacterium]